MKVLSQCTTRGLEAPRSHAAVSSFNDEGHSFHHLYSRLANGIPCANDIAQSAEMLAGALERTRTHMDDLPADPADLTTWMTTNVERVHTEYQSYLQSRKEGAPRRYFGNRAHALYFLRQVSPTKLVDGAWLYGLCAHAANPRLSNLVTTYLEELGNGEPDKNHVTLYRNLLSRYGLDPVDGLPDALYEQGLIQLALGWNAQDFLPEVIGFNLAYEQLPLHLLITSYELNELGIDPYYFTLHVTVDNADTGHARRACQAALEAAPRMPDGGEYWQRVRAGAKLGNLGVSTMDVIQGFDIEAEVVRIMAHKSPAGNGAHSDFCKVEGRSVNDWLSVPEEMSTFLAALERNGWIKRNRPVDESRFWKLLQGERAEMFGVFSGYELQVIHDWIRGADSADGAAFETAGAAAADGAQAAAGPRRLMSFRVAERLRQARGGAQGPSDASLDADFAIFRERYPTLQGEAQRELLQQALSPALHWTPAGLEATREFVRVLHGAAAPTQRAALLIP
ncbi:iron-containing redox enzyme family protein [Acidovorax sp. LjRoot117]|uniref:iron-containing redox enzyme family protein n=1 Tax=Acidovorax sp. LjRoot117 TaxID=3342255 RepID=UPI003F4F908C